MTAMSMKIGYSNGLHPEPLDVTCARAAASGCDGLELLLDDALLAAPDRARALLAEHGLELAAGAALVTSEREIVHPDPEVRAAAIAYLTAAVELVAALGGRVLTVAPAADGRLTPWAAPDQERAWCVEGLRVAQGVGDRHGVRIGIEPVCRFETYLVTRAREALDLAEDVGPGCGVVLDVFHMFLGERDPLDAIRAASARLVNFHAAEHNRLPPGCGVVPWEAIAKALEEAGYDSYVTLECIAPSASGSMKSDDPHAAAVSTAVQLLRSLTRPSGIGSAIPPERP
jgi:D-psicose/D-tagatose/L-ribulose 3-epimerase